VDLLLIAHLLNALLMIGLPVGLAVLLIARWKLGWRLLFAGAVTFVVSQVGHVPFNLGATALLNRTSLVSLPVQGQLAFNAVFLGLSAGLFEELCRYGMYRWWLKDARSWRKGVLAGAGHGGGEALLLGVLALYAFLQLTALRNADLSTLVPAGDLARVQEQVLAYWSMTWYDSLLGALERLIALPIQIALSLLVLQAFLRRRAGWVVLAVGYHALVDASAVLALPHGAYLVEAVAGGFALISLALIVLLRRPEPALDLEPLPRVTADPFVPAPVEETRERLDDTRYA